ILFACTFGAAFGALQLTPQIVPGLVPSVAQVPKLQIQLQKLHDSDPKSPAIAPLKEKIDGLIQDRKQIVGSVQLYQELGSLVGRFVLAWLAVRIVSRRALLRSFQVPGLIAFPIVYWLAAAGNLGDNSLDVLKWGIAVCGFFTISQTSFWGNYLPR